jgi:hypothetical protein
MKDFESLIVRCDCHSLEHMAQFEIFTDDPPELYLSVHLNTWRGFFRRIGLGLQYIFGIKSRHGNWDEVIINVEQAKRIVNICNAYIAASGKPLC